MAAKPRHAKPKRAPASSTPLPSKDEILEFLRNAHAKAGKREIARAFNIRGSDRIGLKRLLAEMSREGLIAGNRREMRKRGGLPPVTVLEIIARDDDGELIAEPVAWDTEHEGERPRARIVWRDRSHTIDPAELGVGDRILVRTAAVRADEEDEFDVAYTAEPFKKLPRDKRRLLGILRMTKRGAATIQPVDRRELREWPVAPGDHGTAENGDLVRFEVARHTRHGPPRARVVEALGNPQDQRKISLIAIHSHGIQDDFPESVLAEAHGLSEVGPDGRTDLRAIPLLTIDPEDARDHDDAVHAAPDPDPSNKGGFVVTVAIADVAAYVIPGNRIDREAQLRGNSVYFPDRVVPMLPERLSTDLCSLRANEDRPCLAVRMVFDRRGNKKGHVFLRAIMRSAAKLAYQEAQAAIDGAPSERCGPLMDSALKPLWQAYAVLAEARDRRAPLDLDLPERRIKLDAEGRVARVLVPERLAAHRLIEEFMIQANVAAAEALEARRSPVVYRIHGAPSREKLKALRDFLDTLDMKVPGAGELKPAHFNSILAEARGTPFAELVNEVVLRSQAQAEYAVENIGHFGLHLSRYAHFTSPIRRYADLLVHRSLIRALGLGSGSLAPEEGPRLGAISKAISDTERRAMAAERETTDRLIAAWLADRVGAEFEARVSGVTRSGVFVRLRDSGADGFVPISTLGADFFHHVEESHALVGARTGLSFRLGDIVQVRLVEAIPAAGALRFEMLSEGRKQNLSLTKGHRTPGRLKPRRGRR
jgi:ribonuclease R